MRQVKDHYISTSHLPSAPQIKEKHPEVSLADLWIAAGAVAVEASGGPNIDVRCGRSDAADGSKCPANGRLPDATQGAQHLRDVFYRMGFDDRAIVCLSGAHTMGRCHTDRSGFEGPWTKDPLKFDNTYFKHLLEEEWVERQWDGPKQYQDKATGELMMLPTDLCLLSDPAFRPWWRSTRPMRSCFSTTLPRTMLFCSPMDALQPVSLRASNCFSARTTVAPGTPCLDCPSRGTYDPIL